LRTAGRREGDRETMTSLWRHILNGGFSRHASRWAASALVLTACSCSSVQRPLASSAADPFLNEETDVKFASKSAVKPRGDTRIELASSDSLRREAAPDVAGPPSAVRQAGYETAAGEEGRRSANAAIQRMN